MSDTLLIVADSERDANMLYATGMFAPDAFIYFRHHGRSAVVVSDLEIDRARREAHVDEIISMTEITKPLEKRLGHRAKFGDIIAAIFRKRRITCTRVPANFSLVHAEHLRQHGIRVWTDDTPIFPQRELKRPGEVRAIERALRTTEAGLAAGISMIRAARIGKDGRLYDPVVFRSRSEAMATSALAALKEWRYKPATCAGSPIEVDTSITVYFRLDGNAN